MVPVRGVWSMSMVVAVIFHTQLGRERFRWMNGTMCCTITLRDREIYTMSEASYL